MPLLMQSCMACGGQPRKNPGAPIKQKVSGCFRTDGGADDFAKLHSIAETAMKNGNSKFNAILAVVQQ